MNKETVPELSHLLRRVEEKFNHGINTTTDFELLSLVIDQQTGEYISSSTLKRLWGYVTFRPSPRVATLDILSRFIGYESFAAYCQALKSDPSFESGFFSARYVSSDSLTEGSTVVIGWEPDRVVTLSFLGGSRYRVLGSKNSKLQVGDEFSAAQFMIGYPLFIDSIMRAGGATPSFVAGKLKGLNYLEVK